MLNEAWVHVGLPRAVLALGAKLGVPKERLERAMGLEPGALSGPEPRLTPAHTRALWTALVAERPEVPLGLLVAESLELVHFGLVGTLMQHSATLGEAIARGTRNQRLLSSRLRWVVTPLLRGNTSRPPLRQRPAASRASRDVPLTSKSQANPFFGACFEPMLRGGLVMMGS